jgi:hypothetical protein
MAAAYQTGTATSPTDLLNLLVTFLNGQGWTTDSSVTDGTGKRAHLHKGSDYLNLRSHVAEDVWPNVQVFAPSTGIALYMGTGYSGASSWSLQAGGPKANGTTDTVGATMRLGSGAISAYHFFDNGSDGIFVVVERSGGLFTHLGFGRTFGKAGTWTGGAYFEAALPGKYGGTSTPVQGDDNDTAGPPGALTQPFNQVSSTQLGASLFVRADVDAFTSKWIGFSTTSTTPQDGYTGKKGTMGIDYSTGTALLPTGLAHYRPLAQHLVSAFNAQAVLLPLRAWVERDAGGFSVLGTFPDVFVAYAVESGYAPGSIYSVNGKNFMLFPRMAVRKYA